MTLISRWSILSLGVSPLATATSAQNPAARKAAMAVLCLLIGNTGVFAQGTPPSTPPEPPRITLRDTSVDVTLPKGGSTVVFGVARRPVDYNEILETRAEVIGDQDSDGLLTYEVARGVPWKSVWFAVDTTTGLFSFKAPEEYPLEEVVFPGRGIGAALNALEAEADVLQLLWVRPSTVGGVAAWISPVVDGSSRDADGRGNRRVKADVAEFIPIGPSAAAPEKFAPGDVLVGIDANSLRVFAARLAN